MDRSIRFEEFGLTFDLSEEEESFRLDGIVENLDEHENRILTEFDLHNPQMIYTNPATWGRTMSWEDTSGKRWLVSFVLAHPDERGTRARIAHEKYHAISRISPDFVSQLHSAIEVRGFLVDWNRYDEEFRAILVQVVSLNAQGIPLDALGGEAPIGEAIEVLRAASIFAEQPQ